MIDSGKQSQKAGPQSQQVQVAGNLVVVQGVTEERAAEIARKAAESILVEYSSEAQGVAEDRIREFDRLMIERLSAAGALSALGNPAVYYTLRKAQIGAACTDEQKDHEILAALLEDRAKRADERRVTASINRAVEIVDQLDNDALTGLTVMQAVIQLRSISSNYAEGLHTIERILIQLLNGAALPSGVAWIEHLDVLGATRVTTGTNFVPFDQFYAAKTPGYVTVGLSKNSPEESEALDELSDLGLNFQDRQLPAHPFKDGFSRLPFASVDSAEATMRSILHWDEERIAKGLALCAEKFHQWDVDENARQSYLDVVRSMPAHAQVAEWWTNLPVHFSITPVGRVLANAEGRRLDRNNLLPALGD
jgi:hypothetical protein